MLRDLVLDVIRGDDLTARQRVKNAKRKGIDLASLPKPKGLDPDGLAVAAALVEMFANRACKSPPVWVLEIGPASYPIFLCSPSRAMRRICRRNTPEALKKRNVFVLSKEYLEVL